MSNKFNRTFQYLCPSCIIFYTWFIKTGYFSKTNHIFFKDLVSAKFEITDPSDKLLLVQEDLQRNMQDKHETGISLFLKMPPTIKLPMGRNVYSSLAQLLGDFLTQSLLPNKPQILNLMLIKLFIIDFVILKFHCVWQK